MTLVKIFSCLWCQNKKVPRFIHLINITRCPFNTSQRKKTSHLRGIIWKNFSPISILSVSKIQCWSYTVSSCRLISKVIIAHVFNSRMVCHDGTWVLYFSCNAETAFCLSPLLSLCHSSTSIVATSVTLLLVMLLLTLLNSVHVCKVFCWHFNVAV